MPNVTSVHITSGVPDTGTGSVSTLDALMADGGQATIGITTGTAVTTDSNGTLQQYARGLIKILAAVTGTSSAEIDVNVKAMTGANSNGSTTMANSAPVTVATDWVYNKGNYCSVAASSVSSTFKTSAGAAGDYLHAVLVQPTTTSCGSVVVFDNALQIATFPGGGTTSLGSLIPFTISIGAVSSSGAWKVTTGAGVSVTGIGRFS